MFIFRKATNLFKKSAKLALAKGVIDNKSEKVGKKEKVQPKNVETKPTKKVKASLKQDEKENNQ